MNRDLPPPRTARSRFIISPSTCPASSSSNDSVAPRNSSLAYQFPARTSELKICTRSGKKHGFLSTMRRSVPDMALAHGMPCRRRNHDMFLPQLVPLYCTTCPGFTACKFCARFRPWPCAPTSAPTPVQHHRCTAREHPTQRGTRIRACQEESASRQGQVATRLNGALPPSTAPAFPLRDRCCLDPCIAASASSHHRIVSSAWSPKIAGIL